MKKKASIIYLLELKLKSGKKKIYTGKTKTGRLSERLREHNQSLKHNPKNTYVGRAKSFKVLGFKPSKNIHAEEKTIKRKSSKEKRKLASMWK